MLDICRSAAENRHIPRFQFLISLTAPWRTSAFNSTKLALLLQFPHWPLSSSGYPSGDRRTPLSCALKASKRSEELYLSHSKSCLAGSLKAAWNNALATSVPDQISSNNIWFIWLSRLPSDCGQPFHPTQLYIQHMHDNVIKHAIILLFIIRKRDRPTSDRKKEHLTNSAQTDPHSEVIMTFIAFRQRLCVSHHILS